METAIFAGVMVLILSIFLVGLTSENGWRIRFLNWGRAGKIIPHILLGGLFFAQNINSLDRLEAKWEVFLLMVFAMSIQVLWLILGAIRAKRWVVEVWEGIPLVSQQHASANMALVGLMVAVCVVVQTTT